MNDPSPPLWIALLIPTIPALAAIVAAIFAGSYAKRSKASELKAQQIRDLENRISEKKFDVYKPIIDALGSLFTKDEKDRERATQRLPSDVANFSAWISIYGSDGAILAFHRFMQAAFGGAPGMVSIRLYAEFVLAVRRDIGYADTAVTPLDLLGMRINDIYQNEDYRRALTEPLEAVSAETNWPLPWAAATDSSPKGTGRS